MKARLYYLRHRTGKAAVAIKEKRMVEETAPKTKAKAKPAVAATA